MYIKTFLFTLLFSFVFATKVFAEIVPSDEQSPPQPSTSNLQISNPYIIGSTVEIDGIYVGRYIASNYQPTFYGSYLTIRNGSPYLVISSYYQVGVGGSLSITDLKYQMFLGSDYQSNPIWSQNLVSWGQVSNQPTNISTSAYQTFNNGIIYFVREEYWAIPSSNFSEYQTFGDSVQILDINWSSLTDQEKFNYAVNFSHASLTTYYDPSIPSFVKSTFYVNRTPVSSNNSLITYPLVTGTLDTLLSDGSTFDLSIYFIDIIAESTAGTWRFSGNLQSGTATSKLIDSTTFYYSKYNGNSLDLSLFNTQLLRDYSRLSLPSNSTSIVPNDVVFNVRLRRKSDGCFGNWLVLSLDKTGYGNRDQGYNTNALTGISSGASNNATPTTNTDSSLTSNANINVTFGFDDTSLGTSNGMSRLVQNGTFQAVDIGSITSVFGQVPQLFGAVFSFLPPFVLQFIALAFTTVVAVAIIKAVL